MNENINIKNDIKSSEIEILSKREDNNIKSKISLNKQIRDKEYNELKKKCFFYMRRSSSQNNIINNNSINFKSLSNYKWKKKIKILSNFPNNFNNETKNITKKFKKKEEEKVIYDNLQPKDIWTKCKKLYNKYKKKYNILLGINNSPKYHNNTFRKYIDDYANINNKKISDRCEPFLHSPTTSPHKLKRTDKRAKSLINNNKIRKIIHNPNFLSNKKINDNNLDNNYIKCIGNKIDNNFINKGINYIIKNRDLYNITHLKNKTDDEIINLNTQRNLPFLYSRKMSIGFISTSTLETSKKVGSRAFQQYKINSFFEIGTDKIDENENDEEIKNDLKIIVENGKVIIKKILSQKKENLDKYKENQSIFNYFCLKKIFNLNDFNIYGVINGKGKEAKKFSRFLKEVLIEKFSDEKNYLNVHGIKFKPKNFKLKSDFIYNTLILEGFIVIKRIFNSLTDELKKIGVDVEESGATLILIILIKDKVISIKVGDMYPFLVFFASDNNLNHIIIKNPHPEHLISNIIEQDRFEEHKCEFKLVKNEMGYNEYEIINKNENIQKYIKADNIKFTRMVGYLKLKKIGIIGDPDIQILDFNCVQDKNKIMIEKGISNSESSDINKFEKYNNINSIIGKLKYIIIGNNELFEFLKIRYYIKEINEALLKDEENNKNKYNIKYYFNIKNIVQKLVNDSVEVHKKYMKMETFKERCMGLITLT